VVDVIVQLLKYGLVLGLVLAWASILLPPVVRFVGGRVGRGADSVGSFRSNMDRLGGGARRAGSGVGGPVLDLTQRAGSATVGMPTTRRVSARKRRRDILVGLMATTGVLLLGALALGGVLWYAFGLTFVLLGAYVALLWTMQQTQLERQRKVAYLPGRETVGRANVSVHGDLRHVGAGRV
jgi:hypothetical protein